MLNTRFSNNLFSYSSYILVQTIDKPTAESFPMVVSDETEKIFNYSLSTLILPAKTPILITAGYFMSNLLTSSELTELSSRRSIKLEAVRLKPKIKFYLYHNDKVSANNENNRDNYIELEPCYLLLPKDLAQTYGELFKNGKKSIHQQQSSISENKDNPNDESNNYCNFFTLLILQPSKNSLLTGKLKEEQILNIAEKPIPGQPVFIVSSPFAMLSPILYKNTISTSYISKVAQGRSRKLFGSQRSSYLFLLDKASKEGEEGSPVFNQYSEVIGILLGNIGSYKQDVSGFSVCLSTSSIIDLMSMLSFTNTNSDVWKLTVSRFRPLVQSLSIKSLFPRIVRVINGSTLGSGVLLNTAGFILTNRHVLQESSEKNITVEINYNNHNENEYYEATLFRAAEGNIDVALLKISKKLSDRAIKALKATERFLEHPIDVRHLHGRGVYALGYTFNQLKALDVRTMVTKGHLSKVVVYKNTPFMIATTCPVYSGFSGGAIVSDRGEFLGLITYSLSKAKRGNLNKLNFSYSCNVFKEMMGLVELRDEEQIKDLDIWKVNDGYVEKMETSQTIEYVPCSNFKPKL